MSKKNLHVFFLRNVNPTTEATNADAKTTVKNIGDCINTNLNIDCLLGYVAVIGDTLRNEIKIYINATIDTLLNKYDRNIVTNVNLEDVLLNPKNGAYKPFHQALIPTNLFRFQAFFRSFTTSLGSGIFEFIAKSISQANTKRWSIIKKSKFAITTDKRITLIIGSYLDKLEESKVSMYKDYSFPDFPNPEAGSFILKTVDLYLKDLNGVEYFLEIKSPKPNKGQSKDTKRDLLKLQATYQKANVLLGLTFNPYGENRDDYRNSYLPYYFDLKNSKAVLIGAELWDFLGGEGTYLELLSLFKEIGNDRKDEIEEKLLFR